LRKWVFTRVFLNPVNFEKIFDKNPSSFNQLFKKLTWGTTSALGRFFLIYIKINNYFARTF
jgi:hypothetical protein